jgi:hypothetical protein
MIQTVHWRSLALLRHRAYDATAVFYGLIEETDASPIKAPADRPRTDIRHRR